MFWNDPNLYSVAFKDIPNIPTPFFGSIPRYFNPYQVPPTYFTPPVAPHMFAPQLPPTYFTPPVAPHMFAPQLPPTYFTPPVTPFMHTPPTTPFIDPRMTPYSFTLPYFQAYRPFGL
jgi:hypothetical protein